MTRAVYRRLPLAEQMRYRCPMHVAEIHVFPHCHGAPASPVCPRCGRTIERAYMALCSRRGQMLDWRRYQYARIVYVYGEGRGVLLN